MIKTSHMRVRNRAVHGEVYEGHENLRCLSPPTTEKLAVVKGLRN